MSGRITLTARLGTSARDARRGVVRLHPEVLAALRLRDWDAVRVTGVRATVALAAPAPALAVPGQADLDEMALRNAGVVDGTPVVLERVETEAARRVVLTGTRLATAGVTPATLRLALVGKVLVPGDTMSLLPQDLAPVTGADAAGVRARLAGALGGGWTTELVTVTSAEPADADALVVVPSTVVGWREAPDALGHPEAPDGPDVSDVSDVSDTGAPRDVPVAAVEATPPVPTAPDEPSPEPPEVPPVADLVGHSAAAARLTEWLDLVVHRPDLLTRLGAAARLGVAVTGAEGVGKTTLVRAVAAAVGVRVVALDAPAVAAVEPVAATERVRAACRRVTDGPRPGLLLVTDVDALLPATDPAPLATLVLEALAGVVAAERTALVVTTAHPEGLDPRLRGADLVDRDLGLAAPTDAERADLLRVLLRGVPLAADVDLAAIGRRTPGFVAADLAALRREAAVRAALRGRTDEAGHLLEVTGDDLAAAVSSVRPASLSAGSPTLSSGGLTLDDVGDMTETKQALTETVLWPLRYPDSFTRLGVEPPRGVLLFGPPGCGKTFLVRALAGTGALNVFVVKGAELLDKYVGESERAVRELFRRAADAAPALVFLDEVDALAPRRGGSTDAGVADRVVAALLTELDGAQPRTDVVVLGATNRPELIDPALLRPGRLERRVYVPPPDADARAAILATAARDVPLAADVDLAALGADLDGYSAADCAALVREAALTAMRVSLASTEVSAGDVATARRAVRPSLDARQLAELAAYAGRA